MPDLPFVPAPPHPRAVLRNLIARQAMPLMLVGVVCWLLRDRVADLDFRGILDATRNIPLWSWLVAGAATVVSFAAVGRYDEVIHRLMATGVPTAVARRSGIATIATAQITGFGLFIGTLARWRMLPECSLWKSARITMAVTVSFMAGLAVIGAAAFLWRGIDTPLSAAVCIAILVLALAFAALSVWRPRSLRRVTLPPLRAQAAILGLVALDTAAAALALYVLLPAGELPQASAFYAVFLLAFGAGLIGATPGGVGPFEYVCLAMLPTVPEPSLLAAIAGYRLVYYGVPGVLAAVLLIAGSTPRQRKHDPSSVQIIRPDIVPANDTALDVILHRAKRAESQLIRQGELDLLCENHIPVALASAAGQSLIVLGDPLPLPFSAAHLAHITARAAQVRYLTPCFYKCSARVAAAARRVGWRVARISQEAWIAPEQHDPGNPKCRQLRRQLRKAQSAELRAVEVGAFLPVPEMTRIAQVWARQRGGARGFSLGRFDPDLLSRQKVFLCFDAQRRLVAFATLHVARSEWTLDQMCQTDKTPPGAMHLLISAAIDAAARQGCPRLSLAAVPRRAPAWLPGRIAAWLDASTGAPGLMRFKSSFNPNWEPLYLAAPTRTGLLLAGLDVIGRITCPQTRCNASQTKSRLS